MKSKVFLGLAILASVATSVSATLPGDLRMSQRPVAGAGVASQRITGDYVECRTASVFAGACHYNGEVVSTGRDAIMGWDIRGGSWNGVSLGGLRAMAAVSSPANLSDDTAARTCELVVDSSASSAQVAAFADFLRAHCSAQIGDIVGVRSVPVTFAHESSGYKVNADGFGSIVVNPMPDAACCSQPNLVWYSPMVPLEHRMVGYTENASYSAGTLGTRWQREDENGAFYGALAF